MFGGGSAGAGGASDGEGIQVLLKAEQEAQRIVGDARKGAWAGAIPAVWV